MSVTESAPSSGGIRVSVVIPVYNQWGQLASCLDALQRQTYSAGQIEIIVVDNGSDMPDSEVVEAFPAVRFLHEPMTGSYAASTRGIRHATGSVIAFTDADCLADPAWIEAGVVALHADPGSGLVAGHVSVFPRDPGRATSVELYEHFFAFRQERNVSDKGFGATANLFVPKRILDEVGSFDDRLKSGGDSDLGRRIRRAGHRIVYAPEAIVRHPARRTYREILRKSVRIAGGLFQRAGSRSHSGASQVIVDTRANRLFIRQTQIILRIYRDSEHGGLTNTLRVLFVASLVVTARYLEFVRLRMGYEPRRA